MSAISDDIVAYAVRRPRLNRLIELLWKHPRNRPANDERRTDPLDSDVFSDMYGDRFSESETIFMSIMWLGM